MKTQTAFVPVLAIGSGITNVGFYLQAFNATIVEEVKNDDGSYHVAGFDIDGARFHLHEVTQWSGTQVPADGVGTITLGLFVDDVQKVIDQAVAAGAKLVSPVTDFNYGYRQGAIIDPFGHRWLIEKAI